MNRRESSATLQHWSWCISTKHEGATRAHPDNWKMKAKKFAAPPAFNICRLWMDQNKTDCPEHKVETKSLAGSDTSHWGSCMRGSSKREVSIWVLWSPAMAPWQQLDNIRSAEQHTTATQENSWSTLPSTRQLLSRKQKQISPWIFCPPGETESFPKTCEVNCYCQFTTVGLWQSLLPHTLYMYKL